MSITLPVTDIESYSQQYRAVADQTQAFEEEVRRCAEATEVALARRLHLLQRLGILWSIFNEEIDPMGVFQRLPLARKVLIGILPLFLLFISVSVVLQNHFQEQEMMEQAQLSARTYAELIRESLVTMMVTNYRIDTSFLERVNAVQQFDTVHIIVNELHIREEVLAREPGERALSRHVAQRAADDAERSVLTGGRPVFSRTGADFRAIIPFGATPTCQRCHAVPVGYTLGAADLHISLERIAQVAAGNWKRSLLIFLVFIGLAVTVGAVMFTRYVSRPVDNLVRATQEIGRGNLDRALSSGGGVDPPEGPSRDELIFLTGMFDRMRSSLRDKVSQLDRALEDLSTRNTELEEALTQLKRMQEELVRQERLAVAGRMTAQLSHEINNPIHNIQSLLQSCLRKLNGSPEARELITVALDEVTRMAKLTQQMLDLYRGSLTEVPHGPVDMSTLLREVQTLHREQLAQKNIRLVLESPESLPPVRGSRDKLKQVFLNLISNARDAMPGGGTVTVHARPLSNRLAVAVEDTGLGIPPGDLPRVFDAFFTTKKEVSGVGLGLSVSYAIIQQHNGSIEVQSTVGEGTTFTVYLPLSEGHNG